MSGFAAWEAGVPNPMEEYPLGPDFLPPSSGALDPLGRCIAAGDRDGKISLWDARTFQSLACAPTPDGLTPSEMRFSADGRFLVAVLMSSLADCSAAVYRINPD